MRKIMMLAALGAATAITTPALAGSPDGKLQVKVLGTAVLPDGGIDKIKYIDPGLAGTLSGMGVVDVDTKANDNVVPTLAVEYFFSNSISVETICCFTQHHVNGDADLSGTNLVNHVLILPATVTAKFHLDTGGPIKPYVGAGPSLFIVFDEKPGSTAQALGVDKVKMSNLILVDHAGLGWVKIGEARKGAGADLRHGGAIGEILDMAQAHRLPRGEGCGETGAARRLDQRQGDAVAHEAAHPG